MPGPYATPRTWFCDGCGKLHPISRDIEGIDGTRKWCLASIERGLRAQRNDLPPQAEAIRRQGAYRTELTSAGEQTVIPGCERDDARTGTAQLDLF